MIKFGSTVPHAFHHKHSHSYSARTASLPRISLSLSWRIMPRQRDYISLFSLLLPLRKRRSSYLSIGLLPRCKATSLFALACVCVYAWLFSALIGADSLRGLFRRLFVAMQPDAAGCKRARLVSAGWYGPYSRCCQSRGRMYAWVMEVCARGDGVWFCARVEFPSLVRLYLVIWIYSFNIASFWGIYIIYKIFFGLKEFLFRVLKKFLFV